MIVSGSEQSLLLADRPAEDPTLLTCSIDTVALTIFVITTTNRWMEGHATAVLDSRTCVKSVSSTHLCRIACEDGFTGGLASSPPRHAC